MELMADFVAAYTPLPTEGNSAAKEDASSMTPPRSFMAW